MKTYKKIALLLVLSAMMPYCMAQHAGYDIYIPNNDNELTLVGKQVHHSNRGFYGNDNYKFGYINSKGKEVIPLKYEMAYPFSNERAAVKKTNGKYGFITPNGHEVIKPRYSDVKWGFVGDYAWVKKGNKWGMIGKHGTEFVGFDYINLSYFDPNTGAADAVTKNGVIHYYLKGKKYPTKKERDEAINPPPSPVKKKAPTIEWPNIPNQTKEQQFALKAQIKSDSKIDYCKLWLNGNEVPMSHAPSGSFVVLDEEDHSMSINETLSLAEGSNAIKIKVANQGGEIEEQRNINYTPLRLATITWKNVPSSPVTEKLFAVRAEINSDSEVEYYRILKKGLEVKKVVPTKSKGFEVVRECDNSVYETITLDEGNNKIEIEVKNAAGTIVSSKIVNYKHVEKRVALVIGNADYSGDNKLESPVNDAKDLTDKLISLGFDVICSTDKSKEEMEKDIFAFSEKANDSDVALFYFSGHGIGINGKNYLVPLEAELPNEELVRYRCTDTEMVLDLMDQAKFKIVILDACRNNPFTKSWKTKGGADKDGGLVYMTASEGTFIAYAASPGKKAKDGNGKRNSPYTQAILEALDINGLNINDMFDWVYEKVVSSTNNFQHPWYSKASSSKFIFNKE